MDSNVIGYQSHRGTVSFCMSCPTGKGVDHVFCRTMPYFTFRRLSTGRIYSVDQAKSFPEIKRWLASQMYVTPSLVDITRGPFIVETKDELSPLNEMALIVQPKSRPVHDGGTFQMDMFEGYMADGPCVRMSCGHAATPDNLYRFCLTKLKDSDSKFRCITCHYVWNFDEVSRKAALSEDEVLFFKQRIGEIFNMNNLGVQCRDRGAMNDILRNCERVTMGYSNIPNVPGIRACPKCSKFLGHKEGCKTMTCSCGHVFCFSCLATVQGATLNCGRYNSQCNVAPVQHIY